MRTDPFDKSRKMHGGIDFAAPRNTPVYAASNGKIVRADNKSIGYGKHIRIDHGFGFVTLYAHLNSYNVKRGQNVKKGDIKQITAVEFEDDTASFSNEELLLRNTVINSIACENEIPATGGRGAETITEIKENSLAYFGAQNRAVTAEDYTVRALAMPAKFGSVAKAFVVQDSKLDQNSPSGLIAQPKKQKEFLDLAKFSYFSWIVFF